MDRPLTHVRNSPPAPPPASRQALCRRRRRSDVLLVLIGCLICLLSGVHLSWHSVHLPPSDHAPSARGAAPDDGRAPPHLAARNRSPVQARLEGFSRPTGATRAKARKGGNRSKATQGGHRLPGEERVNKNRAKTGKIRQDDKRQSEKLEQSLSQRLLGPKPSKDKQAPHPVAHLKGENRLPGERLLGPKPSKDKQAPHPVAHLKGENRLPGEERLNKSGAKTGKIRQGEKRQSDKLEQSLPQPLVGPNKQAQHPVAHLKGGIRLSGEERLNKSGAKTGKIRQGERRQSEKLKHSLPQPLVGPNKQAPHPVAHLKGENRLLGEERLNKSGAKTGKMRQGEKRQSDKLEQSLPQRLVGPNKQAPHPVAHLNCADHGGPHDHEAVEEMVFWSDLPGDASYLSPMHPLNDPHTPDAMERYLTFEPDHGGWNNIRMAMETALVLSHAMGRTLVLPPEQTMYLLNKGGSKFGFSDFFHLDAISIEHRGFKVITTAEFLARVGTAGKLRDARTGLVAYPPGNNTSYDARDAQPLKKYLRAVGNTPEWDPWECAFAVPSSTEPEAVVELETTLKSIMDGSYGKPKPKLEEFDGRPIPVDASLAERMREMLADRDKLCIYDKPLQEAPLIHLKVEKGVRLLTHFYAFVFFADWKQDLWSKRFVRDHLRYVDEIVCAAGRVVEAVRRHARKNTRHDASQQMGIYDAMHVRRGDFQYPPTQLPAAELYELSKGELTEGATLYVATDEKSKAFFDVFRQHYDVVFLDDFIPQVIADVNPNYYGMIDQLVAYKSRVFYGTWWSTLSGYVNRMRGYYIAKHHLEGHEDGTMKSWYFTPKERVQQMRSYIPVRKPIYCREFPVSWRDIDHGVEEIQGEGEK